MTDSRFTNGVFEIGVLNSIIRYVITVILYDNCYLILRGNL